MDQNPPFIADDFRDHLASTERCQLSPISRQTGDKGIARDLKYGPTGLDGRSRTLNPCPRQTRDAVGAAIIDARRHHPAWGAPAAAGDPHPTSSPMALASPRHGLRDPEPKRPRASASRRRRLGPPGKPATRLSAPPQLWTADFKGQFNTGDGRSCDPLTVADGYRRFLLACQALHSTAGHEATSVFTRVFHEFGLPPASAPRTAALWPPRPWPDCRTAPPGGGRRGSLPACIPPGQPQQNGRHARMHRTLNTETTRPPAANRRAHQQRCHRFREEFNHQRPHRALDMRTPAAGYEPAPRKRPHQRPPLEYPDRVAVRAVSANGGLRWHQHWGHVSHTCAGEDVGLEESDDGVCQVSVGPLKLARLRARHRRIYAAHGQRRRRR